jgi:uncharacterized membrane protein
MPIRNPASTANILGHPIHPMLILFPIAFLVATLVCDLIFWGRGNPAWAAATLYLLGAGLIMGSKPFRLTELQRVIRTLIDGEPASADVAAQAKLNSP